jgi:hypothetical protein
MGKKKTPTKSFEHIVSDMTTKKFEPVIKKLIAESFSQFAFKYNDTLRDLFIKVAVIDDILTEKLENINFNGIASRVADKQDVMEGYKSMVALEDKVTANDRVRISMEIKEKNAADFGEVQKLQIDAVGSGQTLGVEFETHLIDMGSSDTKEVILKGKDETDQVAGVTIRVVVDKISRKEA